MMENMVLRLKEFMENEARSCSMDFGCVTPLYVYRMWGGAVDLDEIADARTEIRIKLEHNIDFLNKQSSGIMNLGLE